MTTQKVRFGLLGAGRIATQAIAPALRVSKNAELFAAASRDVERAANLRPTKAYGSYEELLNDSKVDAVYVATHNGLHKELAILALRSGKHVLSEKPLACSARECELMIDAARETGLLLMEGFMYRYHPQIREAQRLVEEGAIGELKVVEASFRFPMTRKNDVRLRRSFGGGALLDVGSYCVNVSRLFLGDSPRRVRALASFDSARRVDLSVQGVLDYGGGKSAVISCGFESGLHQRLALLGTHGVIRLNEPFIVWTGRPRLTLVTGRDEQILEMEEEDTFQMEIEDFCTCILNGSSPLLPVDEGLRNAWILDRLAAEVRANDEDPRPQPGC